MDQIDAKEFLELAETIALFGTWKLDLKTDKLLWSDGVFKMFGYQPGEFEVTFEKGLSIIHPDDRSFAIEKMTEAIEKESPYEVRKRFITKNKKVIHVLSKGRLIKDSEGKPVKLLGVFQDITNILKLEEEHQTAINKLKARNEFIETVIEHLPIGIAVNKISTGETTIINSSFSSVYGWSNEDLTNIEVFFEKVYPDEVYRKEIMNRILEDIQSGNPARMNWENIEITTSKNEKRIVNAKNIPLFDQDLMISTVVDHTESVNSAKKYQYLFQNNPAIMLVFDVETLDVVDCNEAAVQKYGYTRKEFLALNIKSIRPPEDVALLGDLFKSEESYQKIFERNWQHQAKNGEIFWVSISGCMVDYEGRRCSLVQLTDVTGKLLIENNLKESEKKYKNIFENNPAPMLVWDLETLAIVDCNISALQLYGYDRDRFLRLSVLDIRPEEDIPRLHQIIKNNVDQGDIRRNTSRHKKINGEVFYVDVTAHVIIYNGRKCSLAMLTDVTKQRKYELAIAESNQRFEYATNATSDAIWDWDLDQSVYWGRGFYLLFGYTEKTAENTTEFWIKNTHPDDLEGLQKDLAKAINGSQTKWSREYRFRKASGEYAYVADQGFLIRDKAGKAIRMVGSVRDITRKKVEVNRLKLLESVITETNDAVVITEAEPVDGKGHVIIYVNEAFSKMTGYSARDVIGKTAKILQGPLSNQKELNRLSVALENFESCEITTINYKKNGKPFWVNFSVSPVSNEAGHYTHWIAIERDVTAQKNAEEGLRNALLQKNEILESIGDGFFAVNQEWTVTYWNKKAAKMLKKPKNEAMGSSIWDVFSHLVNTETYDKYQKAMTEQKLVRFEDYSDRLHRWFETTIYPSDTGLSVYIKDTSERVSYIKAIEEKNKKLTDIAYTQSHIVRAPLARILGITSLIHELKFATEDSEELVNYLTASATELDQVIREIVRKTEDV